MRTVLGIIAVVSILSVFDVRAQAPSDLDNRISAAKTALADGMYASAEKTLSAYLEQRQEWNDRDEEAVVLYLRSIYEQGRADEVIKIVKKQKLFSLQLPDKPSITYWLALAQFKKGLADKALETVSDIEKKHGENDYSWRICRLKAQALMKTGNPAEALKQIEYFTGTYSNTPEYEANLLDYAKLLLQTNRTDDALAALKRLTGTGNVSKEKADGYFLLGKTLMTKSRWKEAIDSFAPVCKDAKINQDIRGEAWFFISQSYTALTNYEDAIIAASNGISTAQNPEIRRKSSGEMAILMIKTGKEGGAALLKAVIKSEPNSPYSADLQLKLAGLLLDKGRNAEAIDEFQIYLDAYQDIPGMATAYSGRGWGLFRTERFAESAASFKKAYELSRNMAQKEKCLFKIGDAYFANGQYKLASEAYAQFIKEFPASDMIPNALYQAACSEIKTGDVEGAEKYFGELLNKFSNSVFAEQAYLRLGELKYDEAKYDEAIEHFNKLINIYSNSIFVADAVHGRGTTKYRMQRLQEAVTDFDFVLKNYPQSAVAENASYERGICYYRMGNETETLNVFSDFLKNYPKSKHVADIQFWLAQYEYNHGNREAAEKQFLDFAGTYKDNPSSQDALLRAGLSAYDRRQYVRAIEIFNKLAKDYSASKKLPEARFAQANALCELGRFADAILIYEEIINKYPDSDYMVSSWGRKGDCCFTLGMDNPKRYEESIKAYQVVIDSQKADADMLLQAAYKIGRSIEKAGKEQDALEQYYDKVMIPFLQDKEKGTIHSESSKLWFSRAANDAVNILEKKKDWKRAVSLLERIAKADVPASKEAGERAKKIRSDYWTEFLK